MSMLQFCVVCYSEAFGSEHDLFTFWIWKTLEKLGIIAFNLYEMKKAEYYFSISILIFFVLLHFSCDCNLLD